MFVVRVAVPMAVAFSVALFGCGGGGSCPSTSEELQKRIDPLQKELDACGNGDVACTCKALDSFIAEYGKIADDCGDNDVGKAAKDGKALLEASKELLDCSSQQVESQQVLKKSDLQKEVQKSLDGLMLTVA